MQRTNKLAATAKLKQTEGDFVHILRLSLKLKTLMSRRLVLIEIIETIQAIVENKNLAEAENIKREKEAIIEFKEDQKYEGKSLKNIIKEGVGYLKEQLEKVRSNFRDTKKSMANIINLLKADPLLQVDIPLTASALQFACENLEAVNSRLEGLSHYKAAWWRRIDDGKVFSLEDIFRYYYKKVRQ